VIAPAAPRLATRSAVVTPAALAALVGVAWWQTVSDARAMCCMLDGLAAAGRAMPFDAGPAHFAGMWTVMMAAMMLPGIIAVVAAGRFPVSSAMAIAAGYLTVWVSTAVIAFGALTALNQVDQPTAALDRTGGAIIALAGVYQFTGWKHRLGSAHRDSPQSSSAAGAFGVGLSHGLRCLGSSWALMSVVLVVGLTNIVWMAVICAICLGEKTLAARRVAVGVGVALLGLGLVAVAFPQVLPNYALVQHF
jgi:predicted metal-binding membrane protein